jgi:hypothetical protein
MRHVANCGHLKRLSNHGVKPFVTSAIVFVAPGYSSRTSLDPSARVPGIRALPTERTLANRSPREF